MDLEARHRELLDLLRELRPLAVAFSGGVDSSLLLAAAREASPEDLLAVTGVSPSLSSHQLEQARRVVGRLGVRHLELGTAELESPDYAANPTNRCFFCKQELYGRLRETLGPDWPHVVDGTNADDLGDHRPGREAARRAGVRSPLAEVGLDKAAIRALSRRYGLETAELPASPCLSSRLPYGFAVTPERLAAVERGEAALRAAGAIEFRLRHLGDRARLELAAAELESLDAAGRRRLVEAVTASGAFAACELDERPLRSGRLNDDLH
ncbi:MAG: ATP-dependent sacrificial sulfur transferase LarE [Planctomycetota bacterium]